jgi:hypothetical protein
MRLHGSRNALNSKPAFIGPDPVAVTDFDVSSPIDAEDVWEDIMKHFQQSRYCLLRGGCQTGKTSMIACGHYLSRRTGSVLSGFSVRLAQRPDIKPTGQGISIKDALAVLQDAKVILVLDEAQVWFGCPPIRRKASC